MSAPELFVPVQIEKSSLLPALRAVAACPSRWRAFARALREFSLIAVDDPDAREREKGELKVIVEQLAQVSPGSNRAIDESDAEHMIAAISTARWLVGARAWAVTLDTSTWEDSPLGNPWRACVVPEGPDVCEVLLPAFRANARVNVIDPALGSGKPRSVNAWRQLVSLCLDSGVECLAVWTEAGLPAGNATPPRRTPEEAAEQLRREASVFAGGSSRAFRVDLRVNNHNGAVHDRFVGFGPVDLLHDAWHAVSIGIGVCGLVPYPGGSPRRTAVSRIPGSAFTKVWEALPRGGAVVEFTLPSSASS